MMKKIISLLLLVSLAVCLPACGKEKDEAKTYPWPGEEFFGDTVPPAAENVSRIENLGTKGYGRVVVYIDEYSYQDFLDYVDRLEAAGFVDFYDRNGVFLDEPSQERAMFASNSIEGACVIVFWYPKDYRGFEHSLSMQITEYDAISQ